MYVYHISSEKDVDKIDKMIKQGKHVFILIYMEGCGPCNATRPEWAKLESALKDQYSKNEKLAIIDINKDFASDLKHIGSVDGFPTMKYISNYGNKIESYEDSSVNKKDRSVSSFINWIETNINKMVSTTPTSSPSSVYNRIASSNGRHDTDKRQVKTRRQVKRKSKRHTKMKGGKWTRKYKQSINCSSPKGFSQKQYCKYGRRK
jgi:hypothetical protein